jgi:hypothetical protein
MVAGSSGFCATPPLIIYLAGILAVTCGGGSPGPLAMVSAVPVWGSLIALASPGRQPIGMCPSLIGSPRCLFLLFHCRGWIFKGHSGAGGDLVVATMLASERGIAKLLEAVEVRYLANRDDHLFRPAD